MSVGMASYGTMTLTCLVTSYGRTVRSEETPFDGLISFADATELWGLSESTLRKAISYGKLVSGVDARKYGKQWVVTEAAMRREYGDPVSA